MATLSRNHTSSEFSHVISISHEDVAALSDTVDEDGTIVFEDPLPEHWICTQVCMLISEAFTAPGALNAYAGITTDTDAWITSLSVKTAGIALGTGGAIPNTLSGSYGTSGGNICVHFSPDNITSLSQTTAGHMYVMAKVYDTTNITDTLPTTSGRYKSGHLGHFNNIITINHEDISRLSSTDGEAGTIAIPKVLQAHWFVDHVAVYVSEAIETTGALDMDIGITDDTDCFLYADVDLTNAGIHLDRPGAITQDEDAGGDSGEDLIVTFEPDSTAALSDITAGRVHILLHVSSVRAMAEGLILK